MAIDFEQEGLLEGLDGPDREARRELLEYLAPDFSLEELRAATEEGRLPLLPIERTLEGDGPRYTDAEVAEQTGLDPAFIERFWRALGMARSEADERRFTAADLEAAGRMKTFIDAGLPPDQLIEITRVLSRSMSNVAAAVGTVFGDAFVEPGDNERDLALRYAEASQALVPLLGAGARARAERAAAGAHPLERGRPGGAAHRSARTGHRDRGLLRRPRRLHAPRRERRCRPSWVPSPNGSRQLASELAEPPGAARQDDRRRSDARRARARPPDRDCAGPLPRRPTRSPSASRRSASGSPTATRSAGPATGSAAR